MSDSTSLQILRLIKPENHSYGITGVKVIGPFNFSALVKKEHHKCVKENDFGPYVGHLYWFTCDIYQNGELLRENVDTPWTKNAFNSLSELLTLTVANIIRRKKILEKKCLDDDISGADEDFEDVDVDDRTSWWLNIYFDNY